MYFQANTSMEQYALYKDEILGTVSTSHKTFRLAKGIDMSLAFQHHLRG